MYESTRYVASRIVLLSTKCLATWTNSSTIDELKLLNFVTITAIKSIKIVAINYLDKMLVLNNSINITITIVSRNLCEMLCKDIVLLYNYTRISKWKANTWESAKTYVEDLISRMRQDEIRL